MEYELSNENFKSKDATEHRSDNKVPDIHVNKANSIKDSDSEDRSCVNKNGDQELKEEPSKNNSEIVNYMCCKNFDEDAVYKCTQGALKIRTVMFVCEQLRDQGPLLQKVHDQVGHHV